jgi:hypothetical protein
MSVSWTPPDPASRPLDALAFHIQHKHQDKIVQILNDMPSSMTKSIMTKALPKVGKAWEKTDFTNLSRAVSKAAEEKFKTLSKENKAEVLKQLHLDKFESSHTAEIINKIYQVEMLPRSALKHRNMLDNRKP